MFEIIDKQDILPQYIRNFPTALQVVTTNGQHGRRAIIVSAACPMSYDPALLLVCLRKSSQANDIFAKNAYFSVNILKDHQKDLVDLFGGKLGYHHDERFSRVDWLDKESQFPILADCYMAFSCELHQDISTETHNILIGKILSIHKDSSIEAKPLIYHDRQYHSLR